ncbi:MAG: branched-chain amino acid ABC transporter permease [Sulfolobales archaeon]
MIDTLIGGIILSSLLSLMAMGITLLYRTTKVPNFAHASFVTTGIFATFTVYLFNQPIYLGIPLGFIISGLEALLLFYLILEPLRRRRSSVFILMMATLTYDILLFGLINIYADYLQYTYKATSRNIYLAGADPKIFGVQGILIVSISMLIASLVLLHIFLSRTAFGTALRAVMENDSLALASGINVSTALAVSWFIAGGLAGVAGALLPLHIMCSPSTGTDLIAAMFAASILGGLEQVYGAPIGGFILGLAETLLVSWLSAVLGPWVMTYSGMIPYIALIIGLIFFPTGLVSIRVRGV